MSFPDLSLSKLFKDPKEFQEFLVADVGFSEQAASDLLSASLSFEQVSARLECIMSRGKARDRGLILAKLKVSLLVVVKNTS